MVVAGPFRNFNFGHKNLILLTDFLHMIPKFLGQYALPMRL